MPGFGFVGADGTGKTTLVSAIRAELGSKVVVVDEVARSVISAGYPLGKDASRESYVELSRRYQEKLFEARLTDRILIAERTALDPLAYALVNLAIPRPQIEPSFIEFLKAQWRMDTLNYKTYFYLPIEFELAADGVRVDDPDYREKISEQMLLLANDSNSDVLQVSGTVEERVALVLSRIDS